MNNVKSTVAFIKGRYNKDQLKHEIRVKSSLGELHSEGVELVLQLRRIMLTLQHLCICSVV